MAGKSPFFISGGNCKLRVNGITLAYATDFQYSIKIPHQDVKVLGVYEHDTTEPLSYDVTGSFTIIRYVEGSVARAKARGQSAPSGANNLGNGVGSWTKNQPSIGIIGAAKAAGNFTNDGRANEALDPSRFHTSTWFDIEFYQILPGGGQTGVARIRNCKITGADAAVTKRGIMTQTFTFTANVVDEDSFIANSSGVGQTTA
jgi:hypothetical protein